MFGNILRSLRKKHGYSQDDVSDKIKVKRSTYANYERETREPNISVLIELADVYGVSVDYLLGHVAADTMPDDERQLVEKYNQLTDEGRMRVWPK